MSPTDHSPLTAAQLYHACDPTGFDFRTTAELEGLADLLGQSRALEAVRFGAGIRHEGYNIFVLGPSGMGKRSMVRQFLAQQPKNGAALADWCYLNNFDNPHKPRAVRLPMGKADALSQRMAQLLDYLRSAIPALFESEDFRAKTTAIQDEFSKRQETAFKELGEEALQQDIALLRTSSGFAFAPMRDREVMPEEEYAKLPEEERHRITTAIVALQQRLEKILTQIPRWWKERSERLKQLSRETTLLTVKHLIDELRTGFVDLPEIQAYLDAVQQDMVEHVDDFRKTEESTHLSGLTVTLRESFHRYQVNILVTNRQDGGLPIISEDNPSYSNLIGRVEHVAQLGALLTDFTLIKPGALHRANGGYLLLDVRKVLMQPFAWEGLKRALQSRQIRIESLAQMYSLASTSSLEPDPIALDVKVILFGDRLFYYLLQQYDPEFSELFKVAADFEERVARSAENHLLYARMMATLAKRDQLLPFERDAVCRLIEHSARQCEDAERLSTHMRSLADLMQEADYWARQGAQATVTADNVQQAIDAQIRRLDRVRGQLQEAILRDTLLIDTHGAVVGQINGLAVLQLGQFAFAQPTRITATSRLGEGAMVNIEREVKLSGAIHSKGVLIMAALLAARYARNQPLALNATLVFEQSYGMVDGDSASLAELCVLLSHLSGLPISQGLAVTGSVNQLGQVQAIGGVNEKIEGFFDICAARGLTGDQGVLIPRANVKHLMLRREVVAAVEAGQFRVHAVDTVDQALSLLTGVAAGAPDAAGAYPADSVNGRVAARLVELSRLRQSFGRSPEKEAGSSGQPDNAAV